MGHTPKESLPTKEERDRWWTAFGPRLQETVGNAWLRVLNAEDAHPDDVVLLQAVEDLLQALNKISEWEED